MIKEIYVSTDIGTDGPILGPHSMLSLSSAAYRPDKTLVSIFSADLELLPDASGDLRTMEWWKRPPEAWKACGENLRPPEEVMKEYVAWLKGLPHKPGSGCCAAFSTSKCSVLDSV